MTAGADSATVPPSRHWFAWVPLAAAGVTTLCCLGLSAALSGGRVALIWMGLALLVAAQVWDLIRIRSPRLETTS